MQIQNERKSLIRWLLEPPKNRRWFWFTVIYAGIVEVCVAVLLKDMGITGWVWAAFSLGIAIIAMSAMSILQDTV